MFCIYLLQPNPQFSFISFLYSSACKIGLFLFFGQGIKIYLKIILREMRLSRIRIILKNAIMDKKHHGGVYLKGQYQSTLQKTKGYLRR